MTDQQIHIYLPEALYERLREEAYIQHVSQAEIVRAALESWFANKKAPRK